MTTFLKSKKQNIYSSTPCTCNGIYFGDYSNPFEEVLEESMVTVTLSRSQLRHYGDPFKKQWRYYNDPFNQQQRQNVILIIVPNMIQLLARLFLKFSEVLQQPFTKLAEAKSHLYNKKDLLLRLMLPLLQRGIDRLATLFCLYNALEN